MSHPHEKEPFSAHTDFILPTGGDDGTVVGHLHGTEGMSPDEVRHRTAEEHGVDPSIVTIIDRNTGEVNTAPRGEGRSSRSWGFSKWGANWEPTGPKGNPNLN